MQQEFLGSFSPSKIKPHMLLLDFQPQPGQTSQLLIIWLKAAAAPVHTPWSFRRPAVTAAGHHWLQPQLILNSAILKKELF